MLEGVLRTCPDGAIFPVFMQATGDSRMVLSDPALTTVIWTGDWQKSGPEVVQKKKNTKILNIASCFQFCVSGNAA